MSRNVSSSPQDGPRQRALVALARRDRSEHELRTALRGEGFEGEAIDATIGRLREERALDDAGLAARFARGQMAHRGMGRHRIRQALRRRGLDREIIEGGVAAALEEVSEVATLEAVADRYWRSHERVAPVVRLRRLRAFLVRRGFPPALVAARLAAMKAGWKQPSGRGDAE